MNTVSRIAATIAIFTCVPAGALLAQNAPSTGTDTTASPPPAASPGPATTAPATTTAPSTEPEKATPEPQKSAKTSAPKKKKVAKTSRRHEIQSSIDSGTVPSRYRSSVPREYQHYIPWSK
jgi:hypothetical protein